MTDLINIVTSAYRSLVDSGDPRVQDWPLVASPLPSILICVAYVYSVKVLGPRWMRTRAPYELRIPMLIYNFIMTIVSFSLFYVSGRIGWFGKHDFRCQPVDRTADGLFEARVAYVYYLTKFVEFLDTMFFVLRKKESQITVLHVIHHGIMPMR